MAKNPGAALFHAAGGTTPAPDAPVTPPTPTLPPGLGGAGAALFHGITPGETPPAKPSGGGQSISAFFHHLAGDTVATAEGIGPGLYHLATNPVGVTKQLASNEYTTWRPFVSAYYGLFTGDMSRYRRNAPKFNAIVNAHPLPVYLDLLTAGTLGAGRVAALGRLSEPASAAEKTLAAARIEAGMSPEQAAALAARSRVRQATILGRTSGELKTITARAAEGGAPITVRTLPRSAYRAGRMQATDKLLKGGAKIPFTGRTLPGFPAETGVVGEYARAARAVQRSGRLSYLKRLSDPRLAAYQNAIRKLSTPERMALATIARVPLAADLEGWRQILRGQHTEAADRLATTLADPKFLSAYNEPSAALMKAHTAAVEVVKARESILEGVGAIRPETVAEAPFIATRVARGAEFVPETPARLGVPNAAHRGATQLVDRLQKAYDAQAERVRQAGARLTAREAAGHAPGEGPVLVGNRLVGPGRAARPAVAGRIEATLATVPRTPEEAAARLQHLEAAREKALDKMAEAFYVPDRRETALRNAENAKAERQAAGLTRAGQRKRKLQELIAAEREKIAGIRERPTTPAPVSRAAIDERIAEFHRIEASDATVEAKLEAQKALIKPYLRYNVVRLNEVNRDSILAALERLRARRAREQRPRAVPEEFDVHESGQTRLGVAGDQGSLLPLGDVGIPSSGSLEAASLGETAAAARAGVAKRVAASEAKIKAWEKELQALHGKREKGGGGSGRKAVARPTLKQEARREAEREIGRLIEQHPEHPAAKAWEARDAEIAALQEGLHPTPAWAREGTEAAGSLGEHTVEQQVRVGAKRGVPEGPGRVVPVAGTARLEQIGAELSGAKARLARLEERRLARMAPTGLIGGGTPEEIAAEIMATHTPIVPGEQLYHGTAHSFDQYALDKARENGLYGPGVYLTNDRSVASGYAGLGGSRIEEDFATVQEAEARLAQVKGYGERVNMVPRTEHGVTTWRVIIDQSAPQVKIVRAHVTNPFDVREPVSLEEARRIVGDLEDQTGYPVRNYFQPHDKLTGEDVYRVMDKSIGKPAANARLLAAGYDAIRHEGGVISNGPRHEVTVVLDPQKLEPFFAARQPVTRRPQPFYLRDQAMIEPILRRLNPGNQPGLGGLTPPRPGGDVFRSTGALMRTGKIDLVHDTLTGSYLTAARHEARIATHDEVVRAAAPIARGADLPHGMRWVRTIRGQQFPYTQTVGGEHVHELDKLFPDEGDHPLTIGAGAKDEEIAVDSRGRRLAVNASFAKNLESEYRNIGRSLRWVLEKPLDVWRALVLNLRIPWLVNNIVGNNLLYALRFAGNGGLRAYVQLIADMRGPLWVRRLFNSDATAKGLSREDMMAVFPEQHRGTFIGTQLPSSLGGGRVQKAVRFLGAGLAPLDRRTEAFLRRAGTNALLRGSPEAKAFYHAMPKQTRSWRAAMLKAAEQPNLRNLTVREVNDALGDYLSLSATERGAVRRIAPFYGWYREITRIAAHTLIDTPGRALLLSRLATLEDERQRDKRGAFPSFLQGSVALGPGPQGTERILALRSADPFSTVSDLGRAASLAVHPHSVNAAQTLIGLLNPYLAAAGATVYGAQRNNPSSPDYLGPAATYLNKFGLPGSIAAQVAGGLPQVQLAFPPPPSKLYPTRTRADLLARLLGDIRRNPSLQQAHYYASQGR